MSLTSKLKREMIPWAAVVIGEAVLVITLQPIFSAGERVNAMLKFIGEDTINVVGIFFGFVIIAAGVSLAVIDFWNISKED